MHTLVVIMATDPKRAADVSTHLRNDVTAWAKQQPGFISGEWLRPRRRNALRRVRISRRGDPICCRS